MRRIGSKNEESRWSDEGDGVTLADFEAAQAVAAADEHSAFIHVADALDLGERVERGAAGVVIADRGLDGDRELGIDDPGSIAGVADSDRLFQGWVVSFGCGFG